MGQQEVVSLSAQSQSSDLLNQETRPLGDLNPLKRSQNNTNIFFLHFEGPERKTTTTTTTTKNIP